MSKKYLKVEGVLFDGNVRTSSPGGSISGSPENLLWGGRGWSQDIQEFVTKGSKQCEHQRLPLIKEKQTSQVKEFSALLCMGRYKSLGLLKSFLSYASLLSKASILGVFGFSHSLNFLRAPQQSLGMEWGWHLLDHRLCFPFWGSSFTFGGPKSLMTVTSLFIDISHSTKPSQIHFRICVCVCVCVCIYTCVYIRP